VGEALLHLKAPEQSMDILEIKGNEEIFPDMPLFTDGVESERRGMSAAEPDHGARPAEESIDGCNPQKTREDHVDPGTGVKKRVKIRWCADHERIEKGHLFPQLLLQGIHECRDPPMISFRTGEDIEPSLRVGHDGEASTQDDDRFNGE
jgi:hypothetical protein